MAGPGDEMAAGAGGRGHVRASHADREQTIDLLKSAFIQRRLDKDEFDLRVGRALASRTYADLAGASALTAAELRLLPLLSTHLSAPEIAAELFLSLHTIKAQMRSIYRKLGASSRSQAIARARELGLLEG